MKRNLANLKRDRGRSTAGPRPDRAEAAGGGNQGRMIDQFSSTFPAVPGRCRQSIELMQTPGKPAAEWIATDLETDWQRGDHLFDWMGDGRLRSPGESGRPGPLPRRPSSRQGLVRRGIPERSRFDELFHQVKNWGRWARTIQLGAANLSPRRSGRRRSPRRKAGIVIGLAHSPSDRECAWTRQPVRAHHQPRLHDDTYKVSIMATRTATHGRALRYLDKGQT